MAIQFTPTQEKVLQARNHNVLVSAAAGSGKTAVLVERIVRLISEGDHPLDIDRLLVVTFTRAAAAQMRERIGDAIAQRLVEEPDNAHLQRQETLLHNAKITTMDSFFTFILRNNFCEIDIDPGYRQMDETESALMMGDTLETFLEERFAEADPDFLTCVEYWDPTGSGSEVMKWIKALYTQAVSHPSPRKWLLSRKNDYHIESTEELCRSPWFLQELREGADRLEAICELYDRMLTLCAEPGGPYPYQELFAKERELFLQVQKSAGDKIRSLENQEGDAAGAVEEFMAALGGFGAGTFARLPSITAKKYPDLDKELQGKAKDLRDTAKEMAKEIAAQFAGQDPALIAETMRRVEKPVATLIDLTLSFMEVWKETKKQAGAIDFVDLEHYALDILTIENEDGSFSPSRAAMAYRQYYDEILIDEYQDSNDVQELLLQIISCEDDGRFNRFMVGDVKQSIYKFRLARPEIFMEKYALYKPDDDQLERIDLDCNFRSRHQVLDSVNAVFMKIMRKEIGGVEYDDQVSLKCGASYPESEGTEVDPYITELLILDDEAGASDEDTEQESKGGDDFDSEIAQMNVRQRQILAMAGKIKELVGTLPVLEKDGKSTRPCRYGDVVILLRSSSGWNEDIKEIFEKQGVPVYLDSKTGYFSALEIRNVLQFLRVLDNPRQDLPLYNVLHGYWGNFSDEEIAMIHAEAKRVSQESEKKPGLYEAVRMQAEFCEDALGQKCKLFLDFIRRWREKLVYMPVHELLTSLMERSGYMDYCAALPGGEQRLANLKMLQSQAVAFDRMGISGLFAFLRYIDQMHHHEVDYGEANTLDENADVVRIMTIHKSKGLEFPVCIVAGLEKRHSFLNHDIRGPLIIDNDLGLGADYYSMETRSRYSTLRKEAVARKIRRDSLGEELRVLYVAMTRAKEKLILVGSLKNVEKKFAEWEAGLPFDRSREHLPVSSIGSSKNYLDLICKAMLYEKEDVRDALFAQLVVDTSTLKLQDLNEQADLAQRLEKLEAYAEIGGRDLPDSELERALATRFSRKYSAENLRGLYTKTSVSELKHAAMMAGLEEELQNSPGGEEEMATLFPTDVVTPTVPKFVSENHPESMAEESDSPASTFAGAAYGTAVHRLLALLPYEKESYEEGEYALGPIQNVTTGDLSKWMEWLSMDGLIPAAYVEHIHPAIFKPFLKSTICGRMNEANRNGKLYREQPFVLGVPARKLNPDFPEEETVLIQGIIDAFFEENGELVVVDYKTDKVSDAKMLIDRYKVQLEYYAQALSQITGKSVKEKIIYSFSLREEITV